MRHALPPLPSLSPLPTLSPLPSLSSLPSLRRPPSIRGMRGPAAIVSALRRATAMRRIFVAGSLSSVLGLTGLGLASSACAANRTVVLPRAMWVWNNSSPSGIVTWAKSHLVNEIYVWVDGTSFSGTKLTELKDLTARATAAGIQVDALGGDPSWALTPSYAVAWQQKVVASGMFTVSHLDVEPHVLSQWQTDRLGTVRSYLSMLDQVRAAGPAMRLEADVTFWFNQIPADNGTFADEILRRVDATTVMSYRDRGTGTRSIMEVGTAMLQLSAAYGKPVRLGAETNPLSGCTYCTFREEGLAALNTAIGQVDTAASAYPVYKGMAVHDHTGWSRLHP